MRLITREYGIIVYTYLQDFLHPSGHIVMLRPHDVGVHDAGGGVQGVHGGVDTQLGDGAREHGGGVKMSEGGGRGGVSQIVSRHKHGLRKRSVKKKKKNYECSIEIHNLNYFHTLLHHGVH